MSTRTGHRISLDEEFVTRLISSPEQCAELDAAAVHQLSAAKILVPMDEDELRAVLLENSVAQAADDKLFVVVQPTATCQLSCDYCGQSHSKRALSANHMEAIEDRVRTRLLSGRWRALEIGWFGAEPLNALGQIKSLGSRLKSQAANAGVSFSGLIVTNGLKLTIEAANILDDLNVSSIEITLDGGQTYHDSRRFTKAGIGTYARIVANIEAVRKKFGNRFRIVVRCNVDRRNHEGVCELIADITKRGGAQLIDHIYFAPIHNWGNSAEKESLTLEEFSSLEIEWFIQTIKAGWDPSLIPGRVTIPCMVFKEGAELYDAFGNVFNCTEVSYVPAYESKIPGGGVANRYAVDHLTHGQGFNRPRPFEDFFDRVEAGDLPCSSCEILPLCGGKCAKQWESGVAPCPPEKLNLPQRLALEQLLQRPANLALS